jgi:hypothetical protein
VDLAVNLDAFFDLDDLLDPLTYFSNCPDRVAKGLFDTTSTISHLSSVEA